MARSGKNDFIAQGSILAVASILVRIIGMVYRIPMTSIIGDRGNSLYSYAYSIYTILLLLSSYSLPLAVSKMVSEKVEMGEWRNVRRIFQCAILFGLLVGSLFALLVLFGAKAFTVVLYNDALAAIPLRFMAPTILIMSLLGVFRGFFQGLQTTRPTAVSQLLEQLVNAVVSVLFSWLLFNFGAKQDAAQGTVGLSSAWGAAGGTIGTGAGAFVALVFMVVLYIGYRRTFLRKAAGDRSGASDDIRVIFHVLTITAVPVILSTACYNAIDLVDGSLYSHYMASVGAEDSVRQINWGAYTGKCLLMIHIPVSIASAMAVAMVPSLSAEHAQRNRKAEISKINAILRFTSTVAFPCCIGLMILANPIIHTLFPSDHTQAGDYLRIGALAVLTFSFSTITNSILQGIDRMNVPVLHSAIGLGIHIAFAAVLMWGFHAGIWGIIVGYVLFALTVAVLNFRSLHSILGYTPAVGRVFILPLICSLIMGVVTIASYELLHLFLGTAVPMIISVLLSMITYFAIACRTGLLTARNMSAIPGGTKLIALGRRMKVLR